MLAPSPTGDEMQGGATGPAGCEGSSTGEQTPETAPPIPSPSRLKAIGFWLLQRPRLLAAIVFVGLTAAGVAFITPHVRAWYHLRAARSELKRWHNAQAIRHLKVCHQIWPHDPDVLILAAQSARRVRGYDEAERLLKEYQETRGLDDACSFELLLLSAERRLDQVVDLCFHYVGEGHPDTPLILEALTLGYLQQYRLGEARLCLDRWLQLYPDHPQALCLEGVYYLDYGHARSAAEKSYRRVLEMDPEHEEARLGLAVALLDDRNYEEAARHLEYLHQCQPDNLSIQVGLADCLDGLDRQEEAVRMADSVLAQKPDFVPGLSLRGRLAIKQDQFAEAENWLRKAVQINPNDHRARVALVQALNHNGKEQEAQQQQNLLDQLEKDLTRFNAIVTQELVQKPRDPALHCELGQLLIRSGQHERGLHYLRNALSLDPQYAPARKALEEYKQKMEAETRQPTAEQQPR
ncbi:MAG TPA: tetratricopeptide repeat protein [Gemmataceae bacterium]|nr:tetratricopeptide repeat protein [Gemmataceae bacterium]